MIKKEQKCGRRHYSPWEGEVGCRSGNQNRRPIKEEASKTTSGGNGEKKGGPGVTGKRKGPKRYYYQRKGPILVRKERGINRWKNLPSKKGKRKKKTWPGGEW